MMNLWAQLGSSLMQNVLTGALFIYPFVWWWAQPMSRHIWPDTLGRRQQLAAGRAWQRAHQWRGARPPDKWRPRPAGAIRWPASQWKQWASSNGRHQMGTGRPHPSGLHVSPLARLIPVWPVADFRIGAHPLCVCVCVRAQSDTEATHRRLIRLRACHSCRPAAGLGLGVARHTHTHIWAGLQWAPE